MAVYELPQLGVELAAFVRESNEIAREGVAPGVERVGAGDAGRLEPPLDASPRSLHEVREKRGDHAADQRSAARGGVVAIPPRRTHQARDRELLNRGLLGQRQAVLEIVGLLGDLVRPVDGLRFQRSPGPEAQPLDEVEREREVLRPRRVLEHPLAHVVRQVEPRLLVPLLQPVHDAHGLVVVLEPAGFRVVLAQQAVEHVFPRVAEGRVAEVVAERDGLRQVFVQAEGAGDAARDLRDLDRVGQSRPEVVALVGNEDLRLVLQAAERARVDDPVAVPRVVRAGVARTRGNGAPGPVSARAFGGVDREPLLLEVLEVLPREGRDDRRHGLSEKRPERSKERASPTR